MKRWLQASLVLAAALVVASASVAVAQPAAKPAVAPPSGTKWAVVVGVNQYLDRDIPKLNYSVPDAWLVAEQLAAKCGYEPNHILVLTDDQEKPHLRPMRINLEEQIPAWLERAETGDTVFVFFAGHGFLDDRGQAYLAPQDCRRARLGLTGLRTEELRNMLQNCKATQKLLVLDCCHSGSAKGSAPAGPSGQELGATFQHAEGLITLASCRKSEMSFEWREREHGLFTYYVAQGLGGAADYDRDGVVDSDEIYRFLSENVPTTARAELNAQQTPIRLIGDDVAGVFPLARLGGPSMTLRARTVAAPAPAPGLPGFPMPSTPSKPVANGIPQLTERCKVAMGGHLAQVALSPDGKTLATVGQNFAITLYDAATGEEDEIIKTPGAEGAVFGTLAFSPNGRFLVMTEEARGGVQIFDWKQKRLLASGPKIASESTMSDRAAVFLGNGALAVATSVIENQINGTVKLWDLTTGRAARIANGQGTAPANWVSAMAASPDGKFLAVGYQGGIVSLCDRTTGAIVASVSAHSAKVRGLSFSPTADGDLLASYEEGGQAVKLWSAKALERKGSLAQKSPVQAAAFCPDGRSILVATRNPEGEHLRLWNAADRRQIGGRSVTDNPGDWVEAMAFTPDGKALVTRLYTTANFSLNAAAMVWGYQADAQ